MNENGALLQRAGVRIWQPPRHYSIARWAGTKPAYFLAHDELGGFTLALGSWYGYQLRALAQLPLVAPRVEQLSAAPGASVTRTMPEGKQVFAYAMTWRASLNRTSRPVQCELRLRDGRMLIATVAPTTGDKLALVLGDAREPAITRQFAAGWGDYRFTVVVRDGLVRFRAVNPMGSAYLFQESIRSPGLKSADIAEIALPGIEAAELIVE